MVKSTSPSLLLRIRNYEDHEAWDQFVDVYTPVIRAYCFQRRLQDNDTDDIVQDVMTSISKSIHSFNYDPAKGKFRAWFGTIVANRIKSLLAKNSRKNSREISRPFCNGAANPEFQAIEYVDPDTSWVEIFSSRVFRVACRRIRDEFSDQVWSCFEETWLNRRPAAYVSDRLEIPIHTVYVNKSRVLKRLKIEVRLLADEAPVLDVANGPSTTT